MLKQETSKSKLVKNNYSIWNDLSSLQASMVPMVQYLLPLLTWSRNMIDMLLSSLIVGLLCLLWWSRILGPLFFLVVSQTIGMSLWKIKYCYRYVFLYIFFRSPLFPHFVQLEVYFHSVGIHGRGKKRTFQWVFYMQWLFSNY